MSFLRFEPPIVTVPSGAGKAGSAGAVRCESVLASRPAILVHAGAWDIPEEEREAHRRGVLAAARQGFALLSAGASALDAVEEAIALLEDDPALNAGTGSVLDREGRAVLDAGIMEGESLGAGAVAVVGTVRNPVRVARRVMEATPLVLLAGRGAERFAAEQGFDPIAPAALVVRREVRRLERWRSRRAAGSSVGARWPVPGDTVGAVAIDARGRLAAAGSTGGTLGKRPGRVGDTALPGAGYYADSRVAAAASTGWGEGIVRMALARAAVTRIEGGEAPASAAASLLRTLRRRTGGTAGILILTPEPRLTAAWTTPRMARGWRFSGRGGKHAEA